VCDCSGRRESDKLNNFAVVQTGGCGYGRGVAVVEDELSLVFSALADPTRRAILERLASGDATVNQLAEPFAMTQQAVSKHLKVLERARLISRTRTAQSRPCMLETVRLDEAAGWIGRHRQIWADRHDRLGEHLAVLQAGQRRDEETTR
jgi:DNA-binding transcriptional ArsR family regulator